MPASAAPSIQTQDHWIEHPHGSLFARRWQPEQTTPAAAALPIVLLHDSLGCTALWRDFPAQLCVASGHPVIAYDRLGFGRSDPRGGRLTPDFVADEARHALPALRQQLGWERCILFGHSVGGGMAVHGAAALGSACAALITESAPAFVEAQTLQGIRAAKALFADPAQVERLARYHGSKARWVLDAWTETWLARGFAAWSLDAVLPRVHCPLLAIHGEYDEYGSDAHPQRMARLSGGPSRRALIDAAYHVPHREHPARIVALVSEFIAGLPPGESIDGDRDRALRRESPASVNFWPCTR